MHFTEVKNTVVVFMMDHQRLSVKEVIRELFMDRDSEEPDKVCAEKPFKIHKLFTNLITTAKPWYDAQIWLGKATQRYATL